MNKAITVLSGILILAGVASGYDPPERLWFKQAGYAESKWSEKYTWIHDQNRDDCDELLVTHNPFNTWDNDEVITPNVVEMYFGGQEMDTIPDLLFGPYHDLEGIGYSICFLGNLTGNGPYDFALGAVEWIEDHWRSPTRARIYVFQGGEELDTIPDYSLSMYFEPNEGTIFFYNLDQPCDINGDGYNDLIARYSYSSNTEDPSQLRIYYGGEDFDLVHDDSLIHRELLAGLGVDVKSGYDLNGDGFDDMLIRSYSHHEQMLFYSIYLGGSPLDTVPVLEFSAPPLEGYRLRNVNMFPDINNDGCDDWGFGLSIGEANDERGMEWIFFGGDSFQKTS